MYVPEYEFEYDETPGGWYPGMIHPSSAPPGAYYAERVHTGPSWYEDTAHVYADYPSGDVRLRGIPRGTRAGYPQYVEGRDYWDGIEDYGPNYSAVSAGGVRGGSGYARDAYAGEADRFGADYRQDAYASGGRVGGGRGRGDFAAGSHRYQDEYAGSFGEYEEEEYQMDAQGQGNGRRRRNKRGERGEKAGVVGAMVGELGGAEHGVLLAPPAMTPPSGSPNASPVRALPAPPPFNPTIGSSGVPAGLSLPAPPQLVSAPQLGNGLGPPPPLLPAGMAAAGTNATNAMNTGIGTVHDAANTGMGFAQGTVNTGINTTHGAVGSLPGVSVPGMSGLGGGAHGFTTVGGQQFSPALQQALASQTVYGHLRVLVQRAEGLLKKDVLGKCDPYVKLLTSTDQKKTETIKNTLAPTWNQEFVMPIKLGTDHITPVESLLIELWDWDRFTNDDRIADKTIDLHSLPCGVPCNETLYMADAKSKSAQGKLYIVLTAVDFGKGHKPLTIAPAPVPAPIPSPVPIVAPAPAPAAPIRIQAPPPPIVSIAPPAAPPPPTRIFVAPPPPAWPRRSAAAIPVPVPQPPLVVDVEARRRNLDAFPQYADAPSGGGSRSFYTGIRDRNRADKDLLPSLNQAAPGQSYYQGSNLEDVDAHLRVAIHGEGPDGAAERGNATHHELIILRSEITNLRRQLGLADPSSFVLGTNGAGHDPDGIGMGGVTAPLIGASPSVAAPRFGPGDSQDVVIEALRTELTVLRAQSNELTRTNQNELVPLQMELNLLRTQLDRAHVQIERLAAPDGELRIDTFGLRNSNGSAAGLGLLDAPQHHDSKKSDKRKTSGIPTHNGKFPPKAGGSATKDKRRSGIEASASMRSASPLPGSSTRGAPVVVEAPEQIIVPIEEPVVYASRGITTTPYVEDYGASFQPRVYYRNISDGAILPGYAEEIGVPNQYIDERPLRYIEDTPAPIRYTEPAPRFVEYVEPAPVRYSSPVRYIEEIAPTIRYVDDTPLHIVNEIAPRYLVNEAPLVLDAPYARQYGAPLLVEEDPLLVQSPYLTEYVTPTVAGAEPLDGADRVFYRVYRPDGNVEEVANPAQIDLRQRSYVINHGPVKGLAAQETAVLGVAGFAQSMGTSTGLTTLTTSSTSAASSALQNAVAAESVQEFAEHARDASPAPSPAATNDAPRPTVSNSINMSQHGQSLNQAAQNAVARRKAGGSSTAGSTASKRTTKAAAGSSSGTPQRKPFL